MNQANPLPAELSAQLSALPPTQLTWLSDYYWTQSQGTTAPLPKVSAVRSAPAIHRVTVLSASQTSNTRRVAEQFHVGLKAAGVEARLTGADDFKSKTLPNESTVLLVMSTQGEDEPPEEALPLCKFLSGEEVPDLGELIFTVLGLGDSSYPKFCQADKDFDAKLSSLGAGRLANLVLCDLKFQATTDAWVVAIVSKVTELCAQFTAPVPTAQTAAASDGGELVQSYTRECLHTVVLPVRQEITPRTTEKGVGHIEIDLSGFGIRYKAGDALGTWPVNAPELVKGILDLNDLSGNEAVELTDGSEADVQIVLSEAVDITQSTPTFVRQHAESPNNAELKDIADDNAKLDAYPAATPPIGVLAANPHPLDARTLLGLFRTQTPRLYSIASTQNEVGKGVHLIVGVVRFDHHGNTYTSAASGYIGACLEEDGEVHVSIEPNPHFRLPKNGDTPTIMVDVGTGIVPFRAFMQQRGADGDSGKNWLFFSNQCLADDFLYQLKWVDFRKDGLFTRADLAWSRQGKHKVYVQHKIAEYVAEVWSWLQQGAHVYVCGDTTHIMRDIEKTLLKVIAGQDKFGRDEAEDYLNDMREDKRYQRDVY